MSTFADQLPLPVLRRHDLVVRKMEYGHRTQWTIKDPVSLRFFQLRDEEYFILNLLDGEKTAGSIVAEFARRFAPQRIGLEQLDQYVRSLASQGLVIHRLATGRVLTERRDKLKQRTRIATLGNPLAIRWRGVNPRSLINALYPWVRWCFTPSFVVASLLVMGVAIGLLLIHSDAVALRIPTASAFFGLHNLLWIAAAIGIAKVLHELGHALTCKHFGGECREMGLMLLVFTPCLYCNVSDAWMMPNRWHRIAVSGAGIFVELLLASLSALIWWYSEPGSLNTICLNMMIVCSVNTLLFNGNPLLRYDGYYVLSDLVQVPNLAARAQSQLGDVLTRWVCGVSMTNRRGLPERGTGWLIGYAIASLLYRCVVIGTILWMLHSILEPYGLETVAQLVTVLLLSTYAMAIFRRAVASVRRLHQVGVHRIRLACSMLIVGLIGAWIALQPISRHVVAPVVVEPTRSLKVFVAESGRIPQDADQLPATGDHVEQGATLVTLQNPELEAEILRVEERIEILELRIESLSSIQIRNPVAGENLPATQELLANYQQQLSNLLSRREQLRLRAPIDGVVINDQLHAEAEIPDRLPQWSGSPLDRDNLGCTLVRGTVYCLVADPDHLTATAVVDQADIALVKTGQSVEVWLRERPGGPLTGHVTEIASSELNEAPAALVENSDLAVVEDDAGVLQPATVSFNVRVPLDQITRDVPVRSSGWAKIKVEPMSVLGRVRRYLSSTFRFW